MTSYMYSASAPVFTRMLTNLAGILAKAEAYAAERKFDVNVLVNARLAPDMLALKAQIGIATDHAKGAISRLAGKDIPSWPDTEATFEDLKARVNMAIEHMATAVASDFDGAENRQITLKLGGQEIAMSGQTYLLDRALPNFYFHVTTAYAILRHNGVPIGKRDFVG